MSSTSLLRLAARAQPSTFFRANGLRNISPRRSNAIYAVPAVIATSGNFSTSCMRSAEAAAEGAPHHGHEESFEEFTARYVDAIGG
jgi:cytochrome c oxidase subunit 5a